MMEIKIKNVCVYYTSQKEFTREFVKEENNTAIDLT